MSKVRTPKRARQRLQSPRLAVFFAGAVGLLASGCTSGVDGPGCQVGPNGIANVPITGASLAPNTLVFTLDEAPTPLTTEVADFLTSQQVNAAFFIVGQQLEGFADHDVLNHLRDNGHVVGNGTYSHANLEQVPLPSVELRKVDQMITPAVVGNMFFFRSAARTFNRRTAAYLNQQGLQKYVGPIGSDIAFSDGADPIDKGCWAQALLPQDCAQRYIDAITFSKQGIVRFTDGRTQLLPLLRTLLPVLKTAGYTFARLDEVPEIHRALQERAATPSIIAGPGGCNDYSRGI